MPTVLATGPTVTYCFTSDGYRLSSLAVPITIASTQFAYPQRDDQAELVSIGLVQYQDSNTHAQPNKAEWSRLLPSSGPSEPFSYQSDTAAWLAVQCRTGNMTPQTTILSLCVTAEATFQMPVLCNCNNMQNAAFICLLLHSYLS